LEIEIRAPWWFPDVQLLRKVTHMFLDTLSVRATVLCLILSMFVTAAYAIRIWFRKDVRYDGVSEWVGHGFHGLGMTYMSYVMLGALPSFIPFSWLAVFFALCTAVFVFRLITKQYYIWWWDVLHVIGGASMTYMFIDPIAWSPIWTLLFISYYVAIIGIYTHYIREHMKLSAWRARFAQQLSNAGHNAMAIAMILMLSIMQWPEQTARLSGVICGSSTTTVPHVHKH
jgi:hypothetical protein